MILLLKDGISFQLAKVADMILFYANLAIGKYAFREAFGLLAGKNKFVVLLEVYFEFGAEDARGHLYAEGD